MSLWYTPYLSQVFTPLWYVVVFTHILPWLQDRQKLLLCPLNLGLAIWLAFSMRCECMRCQQRLDMYLHNNLPFSIPSFLLRRWCWGSCWSKEAEKHNEQTRTQTTASKEAYRWAKLWLTHRCVSKKSRSIVVCCWVF